MALSNNFSASISSGRVRNKNNPPSGVVHVTPIGIYFLNPSTLIINGGDNAEVQNILIHNTEPDTGIYFVYEFSFMDRAGRFTNNAWDVNNDLTTMIGTERPFRYLIGWEPEDSSRDAYLKHFYAGTNEPQEIPNFPGLFRELTVWR